MPFQLVDAPPEPPLLPGIGALTLPLFNSTQWVNVVPQTIICLGKNYPEHARELGTAPPAEPLLFAKAPSALTASGEAIIHPGADVGRVDYEAELAVIIGKQAWQIPRENAFEFIFGYTALNDVTARELQATFGSRGHPWFLAKSFATFCPVGPQVVLQEDLDPSDLEVECFVNGEMRQQGRTSQMLHDIPTLVEFISARLPLLPGDIIATGTPAGIGPIVPGDEVVVHVESIGDLVNPVIASGEQ